MDKKVKTMALFTVLSMMAVSCQKESVEPIEMAAAVSEMNTLYRVCCTIDGVTHQITLNSEKERADFIYKLLALAEEGYEVSFFDESRYSQNSTAKETVIYTTNDKADAFSWADSMFGQGYAVTIKYDPVTGTYTCIAVK